jgi:hypothetical protein
LSTNVSISIGLISWLHYKSRVITWQIENSQLLHEQNGCKICCNGIFDTPSNKFLHYSNCSQ